MFITNNELDLLIKYGEKLSEKGNEYVELINKLIEQREMKREKALTTIREKRKVNKDYAKSKKQLQQQEQAKNKRIEKVK